MYAGRYTPTSIPPRKQYPHMEIELVEIRDFLTTTTPFSLLPEASLEPLCQAMQIRYLRRGSDFPPADATGSFLYLLRSGAIELRNAQGQLTEKLSEGGLYSAACQLVALDDTHSGEVTEDCLLYLLPCELLKGLMRDSSEFARFFSDSLRERLQLTLSSHRQDSLASLTIPVRELLRRAPVSIGQSTTIREAAAEMASQQVSSALVMADGQLAGLITDRDLRNRCLAAGLPYDTPVREIMTRDIETIAPDSLLIEALNRMSSLQVSHLPVMAHGRPLGMLSLNDLARYQSANAAFMSVDIRKAADLEQLVTITSRLPELQLQMANAGANARQIGEAVSTITDGLTQRLLAMAEDELGPPPIAYAWLAGGSQARREQTSHSDQDNALLLADDYDAPSHGDYFATLARRVCDGLNACGFVYCPGEAMACNPQWRQPLATWHDYFHKWIDTPEPKALMLSSIFFDLRPVAGETALFKQLQRAVMARAQGHAIFLAHMAANALSHRPPLGFFRTFTLIHDGEHDDTFDIKHRGIVPITDIARVLALSAGLPEVNTMERLRAADKAGAVSHEMAENLQDALEYIALLRIRHQAGQIRRGQAADNYLPPGELSELEREHLKDAFKVIKTMQESFETRYQTGRLG